jgi:three-Cys-motif partner protein
MDLFGNQPEGKAATNEMVAESYRQRLHEVAGFKFVPVPLPMRNSTNAVVYYLFFASHKAVAGDIVEQIFAKYR